MRILWLFLLLLLVACQTQDVPATLQAENIGYATESAGIQATSLAQQTRVAATVRAEATTVAEVSNINRLLVATVRAGQTPTPSVVPGVVSGTGAGDTGSSSSTMADEMPEAGDGSMQFLQVTTASAVRDSDGCAQNTQTQFSQNAERIYVVARAVNVRQGTSMEVEWYNESRMLLRENWTIPQNAGEYCLWFVITPDDLTLVPGEWTAQLYADGQPITPEAEFTISP